MPDFSSYIREPRVKLLTKDHTKINADFQSRAEYSIARGKKSRRTARRVTERAGPDCTGNATYTQVALIFDPVWSHSVSFHPHHRGFHGAGRQQICFR